MPRDSNGLYTLPLLPVVDGDIIEAAWANVTIADLAEQLNNVITRDGLLGFVEPVALINGSVTAPALSFATQPNLGLYRDVLNVLGIASAGVTPIKFSNQSVDASVPLGLANGTALSPSLRWASDTDTGIFLDTPGEIAFALGGIEAGRIDATGMYLDGALVVGDELVAVNVITVDQLNPEVFSGIAGKKAGSLRWLTTFTNNVAEAAGNAESNLTIYRYDNTGSWLGAPLEINRSTGKTTLEALHITGNTTTPATITAEALVTNTTFIAKTNASIANLFIGYPTSCALFYRNEANSLVLRMGDGPTTFDNYIFNLTQFIAPDLIQGKHFIAQGGAIYNPPVDPNACALRLVGSYGGGMLFDAGANGFASMYILDGGHVRLRTYSVTPSRDYIHQFNSDGNVYHRVMYGYTDALHFTYHGWDGANSTAAYMKHLDFLGHIYLNNIGQIVFTQYVGATGGIAMTIDGVGVAIAGKLYLRGREIPHIESGTVVTDGTGNATVNFAAGFTNPTITCTGEHGTVKVICTITDRNAAYFKVKTATDFGGDTSVRVDWIAMETTQ